MIRQIEERDIPALVELGAEMHAESSFADVPFDRQLVENMAWHCLHNADWFGAVAEHDGRIVGMFVGNAGPFYFSTTQAGFDKVWYVTPECRRSIHGVRLLQAFLRWCGARELIFVRIGVSTGVNPAGTDRLMQRLGFTAVGGNYSLKLNPAGQPAFGNTQPDTGESAAFPV